MKKYPWLSTVLLLLANTAFGFFLQERQSSEAVWAISIAYIALECSVLSIAWRPTRDFILLGFQSDVGYSLMALVIASGAVVIVVWVKISGYFLVILAASLLLRIDLLTRRAGLLLSFLTLFTISLIGIGISLLLGPGSLPSLTDFRAVFTP
ncbi:hypothetical protein [Leptolyngbya sp. BC1307]|uniref:hypothetical protein n=1 Tax=Leptolyngbya sp. BC1307 TaxID=2029589 RepID=UPI000EFAE505|nr:hypothetical protein [Leptolyngbya sp. BC1307]